MFKVITIAASVALFAGAASAETARDKLVVSPAWLAQHAKDADLVILQVGNNADFEAGHIAGSRSVALQSLSAPQEVTGLVLELPQPEALRTALQDLGISDKSRVIIVPTRDLQSATRVLFTLDAAGLGERASVLDGGINAWKRSGQPTTTDAAPTTKGTLSPLRMKKEVVDANFVKDHAKAKGYSVVDARATTFYSGAQAGGGGNQPKGHVAGAKSVPFSDLTNPDLTLKSEAELKKVFASAGVGPDDEVIAYCHVGQQATAVILAARSIGLKTQLYDGSYEDWAKKGLPVDGPAPQTAP
jgi:thiosulfate/3-mercaptopyruvate sulfurtransferase